MYLFKRSPCYCSGLLHRENSPILYLQWTKDQLTLYPHWTCFPTASHDICSEVCSLPEPRCTHTGHPWETNVTDSLPSHQVTLKESMTSALSMDQTSLPHWLLGEDSAGVFQVPHIIIPSTAHSPALPRLPTTYSPVLKLRVHENLGAC